MSTNNPEVTSPSPPAPPKTSPVRLIVLLGLLALAIGAFVYDYLAMPKVGEANEKIAKFVDERNRMSVKDAGRVTPEDIQKELGMKPTWVDKHEKDQYEVEYYCWWGQVPYINTRRQFISIVYIGDEPRRFSSHYMNEVPPREALPILDPQPDAPADASALPDTPVAEGAGGGGAKGKGEDEAKESAKDSEGVPTKDANPPSTEAAK